MHWTSEESQESEDEIMATKARRRAEADYTKWDEKRLLKKAADFRWVGGCP